VSESSRRQFLAAGAAAGIVAAGASPAAAQPEAPGRYPIVDVVPLARIGKGATHAFTYPDARSPAILLRLSEPAAGGIGPNREIVAYSTLCTHKGCTVAWRSDQKIMICPCHWSTFDPARAGALVIGQASQPLPQVELRVEHGMIQAVGMSGLIYGRHTNIASMRRGEPAGSSAGP
jgi:arsenite oxidase small subunit